MSNTNLSIYEPKKSDLLINCSLRNDVADDLGISRMTLLRHDSLLATTIPAYREDRLGDRQPLTLYQIWCIKKLRQLLHRGIKGKALRTHLINNSHLLNYEAYQNESLRIS